MSRGPHWSALTKATIIAAVVFAAALVGILSRQPGTWAVFWPANALLLGLILRWRGLTALIALPSAFVGYVVADVVTGTAVPAAALLAVCNLAGVSTAFFAFRSRPLPDRELRTAASAAGVALITLFGSVTAAVGGRFVAITLFDGTWISGWMSWFVCEFVNYMVLLPLVLAFPAQALADLAHWSPAGRVHLAQARRMVGRSLLPALLLAALLAIAGFGRGGGAIAFTIPALIAAALFTNVFITTLFVLVSTVGMLALAIGAGPGPLPGHR